LDSVNIIPWGCRLANGSKNDSIHGDKGWAVGYVCERSVLFIENGRAGGNFINILLAAFAPIFLRQKKLQSQIVTREMVG